MKTILTACFVVALLFPASKVFAQDIMPPKYDYAILMVRGYEFTVQYSMTDSLTYDLNKTLNLPLKISRNIYSNGIFNDYLLRCF